MKVYCFDKELMITGIEIFSLKKWVKTLSHVENIYDIVITTPT